MKHPVSLLSVLGFASAFVIPEFELDHAGSMSQSSRSKRDSPDDCNYSDCRPDIRNDVNDICGHDPWEWDDRQVAANVWFETGAGQFLDIWLKSKYQDTGIAPDNWLQILNTNYDTDGTDNTIWSCASVTGAVCKLQASCSKFDPWKDWAWIEDEPG
jgi:hypothetical protein